MDAQSAPPRSSGAESKLRKAGHVVTSLNLEVNMFMSDPPAHQAKQITPWTWDARRQQPPE